MDYNNNHNDDEITIDLSELFVALYSKVHLILLAGVFMALVAFVGTKLFLTPQYTSTTKLYVLSRQDSSASVTYSDLQTGTQLTKDYMELVKSRIVLEQVISVLNLDMTTKELAKTIEVTTPTDSRVMSILVTNEDPKVARDIANAAREAVGIQITEIMDADSVNTVEDADLPITPSSPNALKNTVIGGILGVILAIGVVVLFFMLDDTIKTPEDVEHYLEMNVLASLPIKEGTRKNKKKKGLSARKFSKTLGQKK